MAKKQRIWEKKTDTKRKDATISFRTTPEIAKIIAEKAKAGTFDTLTDYIVNSCLQNTIPVISEGKNILEAVQDAKSLIREFPRTSTAQEADAMFSKVICRLYKQIS